MIVLNRFLLRDVMVNLALYMPLGMSGFLALRKRGVRRAVAGTMFLGAAESLLVEILQQYEPGRNSSAIDFAVNVAGTGVGIGLGLLFESLARVGQRRVSVWRAADPSALALLFVLAGYLTFPWFPHTGLFEPARKLGLLLAGPALDPLPLCSMVALWFAGGALLRAAGLPRVRTLQFAALAVFPLQLMIVGRQPGLAELIGACLGLLLSAISPDTIPARAISAALFVLVVLLRGMSPFHFTPAPNPVNWMPFGGFLGDDWQPGLLVLFEKCAFYGIAIWLLRRAGLKLGSAAALVMAVLGLIEFLQIHLPGRTVETTDPLLAGLIALALVALSPSPGTGKRSRSAG